MLQKVLSVWGDNQGIIAPPSLGSHLHDHIQATSRVIDIFCSDYSVDPCEILSDSRSQKDFVAPLRIVLFGLYVRLRKYHEDKGIKPTPFVSLVDFSILVNKNHSTTLFYGKKVLHLRKSKLSPYDRVLKVLLEKNYKEIINVYLNSIDWSQEIEDVDYEKIIGVI